MPVPFHSLRSRGGSVGVASSVPPAGQREVAYAVPPLLSRSKRGICVFFFLSALARTALENPIRHFVLRNEKNNNKKKLKKKKKADRLAIVPQSKPNWTWVAGCGCGLKKQVCICRIHSKIGFQRLAGRRAQRAIIPFRMC